MIPPPLDLPSLPYRQWRDTKDTLHLFLQILGKIRLRTHPKQNHWWHATLYPFARGITTGRIPYGGRDFEILFDMIDHDLVVRTCEGGEERFKVPGLDVAGFYTRTFAALRRLGIEVTILARPFDNPSRIPFAEDHAHGAYDPEAARRFWEALRQIAGVMEVFRGRFVGKATPVHLFWHSFDLAYTRFSGREAPPMPSDARQSDKEAYSHEVASFGFWAGDETFPEAAFYSYAYPEPKGLRSRPLRPEGAFWADRNGAALGILRYEDARSAADPKAAILDFFESAYQAEAGTAGWDVERLTHKAAV